MHSHIGGVSVIHIGCMFDVPDARFFLINREEKVDYISRSKSVSPGFSQSLFRIIHQTKKTKRHQQHLNDVLVHCV